VIVEINKLDRYYLLIKADMTKSISKFFIKLDEFLEADTRNLWIYTEDVSIYVRKSNRMYNDKFIPCLDLATILVYEPGKGLFTELLNILLDKNIKNIFVESILNERLYNFLLRNGFEECGEMNLIKCVR
jgi:hypothetical protein